MMFKKIENLTKRLVIIGLNSGRTLFIDPKTTSAEIPKGELKDNSKVEKLLERGVILVHPVEKGKPPKRPQKESPAPAPPPVPAAGSDLEEPEKMTNKKDKKQIKSKGGK